MKVRRYVILLLACLLCADMWGQYNPSNPSEPGVAPWKLTLKSIPADVGSFNLNKTSAHVAGENVAITAYNNGNFKFQRWEFEDGSIASETASFNYPMPDKNMVLVARYVYNPSNPNEPEQSEVSATLNISSLPSDGGYTSVSGKKQYTIGSTVSLQAYNYSNFKFVNWTEDGQIISTSSSFTYTVSKSANIVAHFSYSPGNPNEPAATQLPHKLYLKANPAEGGYFNINSGDSYSSGTNISLSAYTNSYYTFKNWTLDGVIISTNSQFNYTMPDKPVTLVANYDYHYAPGSPNEPGASTTQRYHLYGMHEDGMPGQTIKYPVYLENTTEITGFSIDLAFPEGFDVNANGANLTERTNGHTLQVESLASNSYRFFVRGSEAVKGANGKVLEIPVIIPASETVGNIYTIGLSKGAIFKADGSQSVVTARSGSLKIVRAEDDMPDSPDFTVSDIHSAETVIGPQEVLHLSWKVKNIGNLDAEAGWSERIYLVSANGKKVSIGTTYYETSSLQSGTSVSREADILLGKLLGIEGDTHVSITIVPNASAGEIEECQANNTTDNTAQTIQVKKMLYLTLPTSVLKEGETTTAKCQLARSGDWTASEEFALSVSGDGRIQVPATVKIPKDQSSVYFYLTVGNNDVLDESMQFTVQVSGNGYEAVSGDVTLEDDELPAITMTSSKSEVNEGDTFLLTVAIPRVSTSNVNISITAEYPKRFTISSPVVIPAGQTSVQVSVTVVDDDVPSLQLSNAFTASAAGYTNGEAIVILNDDDIPALTLTLTPNRVSESAGVTAVAGVLRRTGKTNNKITVKLTDDASGKLYFGNRSLVLEKGVEEIHFNFGPVDNANVDGDHTYTITAAVWVSSCNCSASGESAGSVAAQLEVFDDDGAALGLTSSLGTVKEGGQTTLTISRNTATDKALTLTLSSDYDENLTYDHTVIIPAGQSSATVTVTSKSNDVSGDSHTVIFTVTADGYSSGTCYLMITDQTLPDARISSLTADKQEISVGGSVTLTLNVTNDGAAELPSGVSIKIYRRGESTAVATLYTSKALAIGASQTLTRTITLPTTVGTHNYYVVINEAHAVDELSYTNNTSAEVSIQTISPFTVIVSTDKNIYIQGDKVQITGQLTGNGTANTDIDLYVINEGARQVKTVTTDAQGAFSYEWELYALQSGHFAVGACYPGEDVRSEMTGFDVYGLRRTSNDYITCETKLGEIFEGSFEVENPGLFQQTFKSFNVVSKPNDCNVILEAPSVIAANGRAHLTYKLIGSAITTTKDWELIKVRATTQEGVQLDVTLYYYCAAQQAVLTANTTSIKTTMTKGSTREYLLNVMNTGKVSTGRIKVRIPEVSWMKLGTPSEMSPLEYGETATICLQLTPTSDMALNMSSTGRLAIECENGNGIAIDYNIETVSDATGVLSVDVVDEYSYYTQEKPHVSGAGVVVKHPTTGAIVAQGKTNEQGLFSVELPEGYYTLMVTEDHHSSITGNVLVDPGITKKEEIFLSYSAVSYSWDVVETEIEDEYKIETIVKYETNVPKPVVVVNLPTERPSDNSIIAIIVTNKGLINAQHLDMNLNCTDGYELELLNPEQVEILSPQQSYVFYARFKQSNPNGARTRAWGNPNADCVSIFAGATFDYLCGNHENFEKALAENGWGDCMGNGNSNGSGQATSWRIRPVPHSGPSSPSGGGGASGPIYNDTGSGGLETLRNWFCNLPCSKNLTQSLACEAVGRIVPEWLSCAYNLGNQLFFGDWIGRLSAFLDCADLPNPFGGGCWDDYVNCMLDHFNINLSRSNTRNTSIHNRAYETAANFKESNDLVKSEGTAYWNIIKEHFGDEVWLECDNQELAAILSLVETKGSTHVYTVEDFSSLKPQRITDGQLAAFVERINNTFQHQDSGYTGITNYINPGAVANYSNIINECEETAKAKGFMNLVEMHTTAYNELKDYLSEGSNSVCATVTIKISQEMVMTRQAFRGTLTVFNGNETTAMRDVKLTLNVTSENGTVATAHEFQINAESLEGFTGELSLTDGWTLAANETGTATILFIPTKYAAPTEPVKYSFGGTLSYVDPFTGLEVTRELFPVTLTVKPSPELDLTYFMQRDIYGDDALTLDKVEPMVPAEFALLINNKGNGDATNVRMVTQQPEIIENEKGLYIDFEIISSQVNGGEANLAFGKSIANDFGTIPAHSQAYAQWWLTSTLLGHFTEYDIQANHVTSYGNEDLSLLGDVSIHEMIRSLDLSAGNQKMVGFLVNDLSDAEDLPDMLYLSNGEIKSVVIAASASMEKTSSTTYKLTVTPQAEGWNYGNLIDPTSGMSKLKRIVRQSDGKEINLRNFWQTDRTLRDGRDPLYEYHLHFADELASASTETYTLTFDPLPNMVLAVSSIDGIPEEGTVAIEPVNEVTVNFNKDIKPETFTADDITFAVQGVKQDTGLIGISTTNNKNFKLDLTTLTEQCSNGYYTLTVQAADITDYEDFQGKDGKQVNWILFRGGLVQLLTSAFPVNSGTVSRKSETPASTRADSRAESDANSASYGSTVTLVATANPGYEFSNWTLNGEQVSTNPEYEVLAINDLDIVANFTKKQYSIEIESESEGGHIRGSGTGIYDFETKLELIAEPEEDYVFAHWVINDEVVDGDKNLKLSVDKVLQVTAVFTREYYRQTLSMARGWNWISTYLGEPLATEAFNYISRIVGQTDELINDPEYGLVGNLTVLEPGKSYKLEASRTFSRTLRGHQYDAAVSPISLRQGWNWMAYPYQSGGNLSNVIINPDEGDYIVSQSGFAEYAGGSWQGSFDTFIPGNGYLYKSATEKVLTFDVSDVSPSRTRSASYEQPNTETFINIHRYPNTMNMTIRLMRNGIKLPASDYNIYAMADGEMRGVSQAVGDNHYLTVYGDKLVEVTFMVESAVTGDTYEVKDKLTFCNDVVGSRKNPYSMSIGGTTGIESIEDADRPMTVYSLQGILISRDATLKALKHLPKGVYIINGQKCYIK